VTSIQNLDWLPMPRENYGLKIRVSHLNGNIGLDLQPICNITKLFTSFLLEECKKRIWQQRYDPNWHGCKTWQTLLKEHLYKDAQIWVQIRVSIRIRHIPLNIYS
jgi:hypothetical protein